MISEQWGYHFVSLFPGFLFDLLNLLGNNYPNIVLSDDGSGWPFVRILTL